MTLKHIFMVEACYDNPYRKNPIERSEILRDEGFFLNGEEADNAVRRLKAEQDVAYLSHVEACRAAHMDAVERYRVKSKEYWTLVKAGVEPSFPKLAKPKEFQPPEKWRWFDDEELPVFGVAVFDVPWDVSPYELTSDALEALDRIYLVEVEYDDDEVEDGGVITKTKLPVQYGFFLNREEAEKTAERRKNDYIIMHEEYLTDERFAHYYKKGSYIRALQERDILLAAGLTQSEPLPVDPGEYVPTPFDEWNKRGYNKRWGVVEIQRASIASG